MSLSVAKLAELHARTHPDPQEKDIPSHAQTAVLRILFLSLPWRARTTTAEHVWIREEAQTQNNSSDIDSDIYFVMNTLGKPEVFSVLYHFQ